MQCCSYKPRAGSHHQEPGEGLGEDAFSEPPERINPADTLISDVWPLQVSEEKFCSFKLASLLVICPSSPGSRIHLLTVMVGWLWGWDPPGGGRRDSAQN